MCATSFIVYDSLAMRMQSDCCSVARSWSKVQPRSLCAVTTSTPRVTPSSTLSMPPTSVVWCGISSSARSQARGRLTFFLSQRVFARACLEASLRSLTTIKFKLKSCRCIRDSDKSAYDTPQRIWEDAQRVVEKGLKPHTDLPDAMLAEIFRHAPRLEGCTSCWRTLDEKLDLLERQWYGARSGVSVSDLGHTSHLVPS